MIKFKGKFVYYLVVSVFVVLFIGVLVFDAWVYKSYVYTNEVAMDENILQKVFLLNRSLLKKVADKISEKESFLENPIYPLLKTPF